MMRVFLHSGSHFAQSFTAIGCRMEKFAQRTFVKGKRHAIVQCKRSTKRRRNGSLSGTHFSGGASLVFVIAVARSQTARVLLKRSVMRTATEALFATKVRKPMLFVNS